VERGDPGVDAGAGDIILSAVRARRFPELMPIDDAPTLRVIDSRRNGTRLDVRLAADDGRAWLVVAQETALGSGEIGAVTVHARPPRFDGSTGGLVLVLNGPSSVGSHR
jgi:hypothetical protein